MAILGALLGALYMPFRAPIWMQFWVHVWLIFSVENLSGFVPLRDPILGSIWDAFRCYFQHRNEDMFFYMFLLPFGIPFET